MIERILIRHNALWLVGAILAACLLAFYITAPEQSEAERQVEEYCEMVDIWQDTDGEYGWPDYNGHYDEVCDD